jgi:Zn-dependent peptidase ImmA (M78 family)/transcriptional regulator with XRE-family HTH domain
MTLMSGAPLESWAQVGARVALARERSGFSQRELAERLGLDRSAVTRIEQGTRRLDALELVRLAQSLGRTTEWFLTASPNVIASRRAELGSDQNAERLADTLELLYRDVELLVELNSLTLPTAAVHSGVSTPAEAEAGAIEARRIIGTSGPLPDLQVAVEQAGLLAFSFDLGPAVVDGGYVRLHDAGIALVNGSADPGRRRFTLAHELGHHLLADEYTMDFGLGTSRADREALINAFAIFFLMPRVAVLARWAELSEEQEDPRSRLIMLAAEYRVSWSAVVTHAATLELIPHSQVEPLRSQRPRYADYFALRVRFEEELRPISLAPAYLQATVRAYRRGVIKVERAVELLRHTVSADDLRPPPEFHIEELAPEFDDLGQ